MDKELESIGGRLKAWRHHLHLSGIEFSNMVGIHVSMIRKYESNVVTPNGDTLIAIAKTGLNIQWLLLGEGCMSNDSETMTREESILQMLNELDQPKRDALLNEFFARIQDAKQINELKEILNGLVKKSVA